MVTNADVVRILERIADLLDIKGENPFKGRAYRQAAVQVENLSRPLSEIASQGAVETLRAVAGLQVDCRAVAPSQFGAAWQYFTGAQGHNVRLRSRALRRGLTLNEYGIFRLEGGERIAGETEEGVYGALGLRWIPPEQREDRGEIEAAAVVDDPEPAGCVAVVGM